jgi:hypothetical protein
MVRKYRQELALDNNQAPTTIPPEYLLSAMGQVAHDLDDVSLEWRVITLNETSGSNLPHPEAVTLLAEKDPNALENVLTLAEEMHNDVLALLKKQARRGKQAEWLRAVGWSTIYAMGAFSMYGNGLIIPPETRK